VKGGQHLAKHYGIKVRYYGEHVGEHIGNQGKMKKKQGTWIACLGLAIGCMKFLFPKEFITIFGLG
jgi:hypothetical protein